MWVAPPSATVPFFYNAEVKSWDVIVVGAGIIGLSLARELRKRDASVLVVERGQPGREASRAAAGMLADCGDEKTPTVLQPFAQASAEMYPEFAHELEDESGICVDLRDEGTILFPENRSGLSSSITLSDDRLAKLEPNVTATGRAPLLLHERSVDPRALVTATLKACKHRGVDMSSGDAVVSVDVADGRVTGVTTSKTRFHAPVVVNCAGAWSGRVPPHRFPTRPVKGQMLVVVVPSRPLLRHVIRSPEVYLVPRSDGRLLVGSTLEEAGYDKRTDPDTIHRLHQAAIALVPALGQARILEDWAGLRPATPDSLPILGPTRTPGYFVATGHFRDGILLTPATARVMAQVMGGESPSYDVSAFTPERFQI